MKLTVQAEPIANREKVLTGVCPIKGVTDLA
jgi:hypothetical protein